MKYGKDYVAGLVAPALLVVALSAQLPLAALADSSVSLKPEAAALDTSQPTDQAAVAASAVSVQNLLFGSARKHDAVLDSAASASPVQTGTVNEGNSKLQSETATPAAGEPFKLAAHRLATGARLSAEDYRALGVGCAGYESDRTFFQKVAVVSVVYPGGPADLAGIRKGDKILTNDIDNAQAVANPTVPQYQVTLDREGTPVTLTLLKHKEKIPITLTRINIEDIQTPKYREQWEKIVRDLGYPKSGTFTGDSLKTLSPGY